jgi:hypothetical protein
MNRGERVLLIENEKTEHSHYSQTTFRKGNFYRHSLSLSLSRLHTHARVQRQVEQHSIGDFVERGFLVTRTRQYVPIIG